MWVWLDRVGLILFDATVSTALFLSLVVLAMLICRQPSRRIRIARAALLSSLLMIPMVSLAPLPRLDVADAIIRSDLIPAQLIFNPDQAKTTPTPASPRANAGSWLGSGDLSGQVPRVGRWLERCLTLTALAGVIIGLCWLILGFWGVRWLIRHSRQPSARTQALFGQLLRERGTARGRAALCVSTRIKRPVVVGLFRPTILIPESFEEPHDEGEFLRLTLLHEMAHAEQSDPWFGTTASLAQTVWFFLPQIWWLRSQLLIDQEFLADRFAAKGYGTPSGYAASLLMLAEARASNSAAGPRDSGTELTGPTSQDQACQSPLFQRVLMLLHCPFRFEAHAPRSWSWTLRLTVIGASVMAACLCLRWPSASAIEVWQKGKSSPSPQTFRVTHFVAKPMVYSKDQRSLPYTIPLVLQPRFELKVDVFSSAADLAHIRIAGHCLGRTRLSTSVHDDDGNVSGDPKSWHEVRLVRDHSVLSLWVDGQSIPVDPDSQSTGERLTIEPGALHEVTFRKLVVTW